MEHLKDLPASSGVAKNLFLKDKKKNLYLLSTVYDKAVKLNDIGGYLKREYQIFH